MTETYDASTDAPLLVEYEDAVDDVDHTAAAIGLILAGVNETVSMLRETIEAEAEPDTLTQDHVEQFKAALLTGKRLVDHEDYEAFVDDGLDALDDELIADIREDVAPLAPVYGVELPDVLKPKREPPAVEDYLTIDVDSFRRGA